MNIGTSRLTNRSSINAPLTHHIFTSARDIIRIIYVYLAVQRSFKPKRRINSRNSMSALICGKPRNRQQSANMFIRILYDMSYIDIPFYRDALVRLLDQVIGTYIALLHPFSSLRHIQQCNLSQSRVLILQSGIWVTLLKDSSHSQNGTIQTR